MPIGQGIAWLHPYRLSIGQTTSSFDVPAPVSFEDVSDIRGAPDSRFRLEAVTASALEATTGAFPSPVGSSLLGGVGSRARRDVESRLTRHRVPHPSAVLTTLRDGRDRALNEQPFPHAGARGRLHRRDVTYPELPAALCEWDPGFACSAEAAAVAQDFDLPTVVADASGAYMLRRNFAGDDDPGLQRALGVLERMASSGDRDVKNCAVTEIIERLPGEAPGLADALGPASADLYRRFRMPR